MMRRRRSHSSSGAQLRRRVLKPQRPPLKGFRGTPTWARMLWGGTFALLGAGLLWILSPVFAVLAASAGIAYILDPLVDWLEARGVSREGGIGIVFTVLFTGSILGMLMLVPSFIIQGSKFVHDLIPFVLNLDNQLLPAVDWVTRKTGYEIPLNLSDLQQTAPAFITKNSAKLQAWVTAISQGLLTQGIGLINAILNLTLMPIFTYYLLRDWDRLIAGIGELVPPRIYPQVERIAVEVNERLSAFVRGQITVCLSLAVLYSIGLLIVGIDLAIPVGVLSGLLFIIPYLGTLVGVVLGVLLALMKFGFTFHVLAVMLVFAVVQGIEGSLLTPKIVGDKVGLHPLVVMIALIVGASLMGIWGMLLAIPITAVLSVLGREWLQGYFDSVLFTEDVDER